MKASLTQLARMAEHGLAGRLSKSSAARLLGFELVSAEHGRAMISVRVYSKHRQVYGVVHGGILAALADTAGGFACYASLPKGRRLATIEMNINYLEPVVKGTLLADAKVLRIGRNTAVAECDVRDKTGLLVAKALLTFSIGRVKRKA